MGNLICAHYNKTPLIVTAGQQTREMLLLEPYLTNVCAVQTPQRGSNGVMSQCMRARRILKRAV